MNILFCSVPFRPSVGGIETVSALLAERFVRAGHSVVLVTQTPDSGPGTDAEPFEIVRRPSPGRLWSLVRWADVVFHNNISLRWAWPLILTWRPWVVAHHTWIPRRGPGALAGWCKRMVLPRAHNIAISNAIARSVRVRCSLVPNPYADEVFRLRPDVPRTGDLVFVGRLVSDKGVTVLLDALTHLKARGLVPRLTVVGEGPEAPVLRKQALDQALGEQVSFVGSQSGAVLVATLNAHRIAVIPSVWEEPFGLVALEAMACGCVPVGARSGGLPDAIGEAGLLFAKGDAVALADSIACVLGDESLITRLKQQAPAHLARHAQARVAADYLRVLQGVVAEHGLQGIARRA